MRIPSFIALCLCLPIFSFAQLPVPASATELGVAHIGGLYSLSETDYLNEGADAALAIGAKCIKVSLSLDTDNPSPKLYPFHSEWPAATTLEGLADTPYYRALFAKNFDTYVLTAFRPGHPAGYWRESFTDDDEAAETICFFELARYFLETYAATHKTFIIQNWEGDWALRGKFDPSVKPTEAATKNMIRWLNARQQGVNLARSGFRAKFPSSRTRVFHACEVNLVRQSMEKGAPGVTTDVLPNVDVDLASYSSWDTVNSPDDFGKALTFIAQHKRPNAFKGERGVYIGEFGLPEDGHTPQQVLDRTSELLAVAQKYECPFAIYWQLYCNEPIKTPPKQNADYKGFWLIRPDATRSLVCQLFATPPK